MLFRAFIITHKMDFLKGLLLLCALCVSIGSFANEPFEITGETEPLVITEQTCKYIAQSSMQALKTSRSSNTDKARDELFQKMAFNIKDDDMYIATLLVHETVDDIYEWPNTPEFRSVVLGYKEPDIEDAAYSYALVNCSTKLLGKTIDMPKRIKG